MKSLVSRGDYLHKDLVEEHILYHIVIARQHAMHGVQYCFTSSVHLYIHPMLVLCLNEWK